MSGLTKPGVKLTVSKPFIDIDGKALDALIARVTEAKENSLALSPEDCQLLLDSLVTLSTMQHRLAHHDVTVHKLRKLLGIKLTASTVFDQVKRVCDAIYPVHQRLFSLTADAAHYDIDDTTHRILDQTAVEKKVRNSDKTQNSGLG